jgi:hypothetical protein
MPLTPWLKRLFILKKTAIHMRRHKEGEHDNNNVMVHPSDGDAWKALDNFDPDFARDVRNVRIRCNVACYGFANHLLITFISCLTTHQICG